MCCCRFENIWNALPQTCKSNVNKNSNYFELALSSPFSQEIQIIELWNSVEGLPPLPRSFCLLLFPTHIPIQPQTKPTRSNTHLPTHTHTLLSIPFSESISFMNDSSCPGIKRHVVTQIKYHWLRRFHLNQTKYFWRLLVRPRVGWADLGDTQKILTSACCCDQRDLRKSHLAFEARRSGLQMTPDMHHLLSGNEGVGPHD